MNVAELRTVLEEVQAIYEASGSDKPAGDLRDFIDLLEGYENESVDEFLAGLSTLLKVGSSKGGLEAKLPGLQIVASFIERLTAAGTNPDQFDPVYTELGASKQVRIEEMNAIAHGYI